MRVRPSFSSRRTVVVGETHAYNRPDTSLIPQYSLNNHEIHYKLQEALCTLSSAIATDGGSACVFVSTLCLSPDFGL